MTIDDLPTLLRVYLRQLQRHANTAVIRPTAFGLSESDIWISDINQLTHDGCGATIETILIAFASAGSELVGIVSQAPKAMGNIVALTAIGPTRFYGALGLPPSGQRAFATWSVFVKENISEACDVFNATGPVSEHGLTIKFSTVFQRAKRHAS